MPSKVFLKLDGVDGQSEDDKHSKWFEIDNFAHNMNQGGSFGKDGTLTGGTVSMSDFTFTKEMDASSPVLCEKLVTGAKIDKAVVHLVSAVGAAAAHVYAKYEFTPCVVSNYAVSGSTSGDVKPSETVSIRFNIVRWEFTPYDAQDAGNAIRSGWDTSKSAKDSTSVSE